MSTLRVNQALHGYRDGHRLLQSSLKLSPEGQSLLLANSDATGPAVQQGFGTYLSGFGLLADRVYVFARTWFAHEMERPGCVWTHSLMVDWDTLRDLDDYSPILRAFRRPAHALNTSMGEYGMAISLSDHQSIDRGHEWVPQLSAALTALYADDRRSVVFASERSDRWDDAVLSLWASQWWTLRRALTFCTGQLSERPGTRRIDIQVVPQERRFRWRQSDAVLIDDAEIQTGQAWLPGIQHALRTGRAIDAGLEPNLRASLPPERSAGPLVLEVARTLGRAELVPVTHLLDSIAHRYPEPAAASGLKSALLGENGFLWKRALEQGRAGSELARYALLSEHSISFDRTALSLRSHLERIWRMDRADATSLLLTALHSDSSDAIEELLRAACASLSEQDLIQLAQSEPGTIHALAQSRPALLSQKAIWQSSAQVRRELATALVRAGVDHPNLVSAGISAALEAGAVDSLAELVRRAETPVFAEVVTAVLNILPSVPGWQAHAIVAALRNRASDVVRLWQEGVLRADSGTVSLMTVFEPTAYYGRLLGPALMTQISSQDAGLSTPHFQCVGPTFALVTALDDGGELFLDAAATAFSKVHAAAARSALDQWSLNSLDRILPRLGWRRDWDICERLRVAAAERLIEQRWPIAVLFRLLPNASDFEWLLRTIHGQRHGRHFLKDAAKRGTSLGATTAQLSALEDAL